MDGDINEITKYNLNHESIYNDNFNDEHHNGTYSGNEWDAKYTLRDQLSTYSGFGINSKYKGRQIEGDKAKSGNQAGGQFSGYAYAVEDDTTTESPNALFDRYNIQNSEPINDADVSSQYEAGFGTKNEDGAYKETEGYVRYKENGEQRQAFEHGKYRNVVASGHDKRNEYQGSYNRRNVKHLVNLDINHDKKLEVKKDDDVTVDIYQGQMYDGKYSDGYFGETEGRMENDKRRNQNRNSNRYVRLKKMEEQRSNANRQSQLSDRNKKKKERSRNVYDRLY